VERAGKLKMGDTTKDKANVIGPLINDRQVARVKAQIEDALAGVPRPRWAAGSRALRRAHDPDRRDPRDGWSTRTKPSARWCR
jgi:acyl-CoA reductase-like NAD-dependent aldehyde dehydrogenase